MSKSTFMAVYHGMLDITGSVGEFSFYKRKGSDKTIVRRKGGASAQKVKNDPRMAGTRRVNKEFGGVSSTAKAVRACWGSLRRLEGAYTHSALVSVLHSIQKMDTDGVYGKRSVYISKAAGLLEGFQLNNKSHFEHFIANPLKLDFSTSANTIFLTIPALQPNINLFIPQDGHGWFSLVMTCAMVPDFLYHANLYRPATNYPQQSVKELSSDWLPFSQASTSFTLEMPYSFHEGKAIYMIGVGIRIGHVDANGNIRQVKDAGAAKVLAMPEIG